MTVAEVAAKLAVEGAVAAIAGAVSGRLGLQPRVLSAAEKQALGVSDPGETLSFETGEGGVFMHSDGACTTIWFAGGDCMSGIEAMDVAIKRAHPSAVVVRDEAHANEPNFKLRTYDIHLPNNQLAILDAVYPTNVVSDPRFMARITAMARQN
ncbi:MAG: hypothetical protein ACT4OF_12945 [Caulobacteraceae bacterium]